MLPKPLRLLCATSTWYEQQFKRSKQERNSQIHNIDCASSRTWFFSSEHNLTMLCVMRGGESLTVQMKYSQNKKVIKNKQRHVKIVFTPLCGSKNHLIEGKYSIYGRWPPVAIPMYVVSTMTWFFMCLFLLILCLFWLITVIFICLCLGTEMGIEPDLILCVWRERNSS